MGICGGKEINVRGVRGRIAGTYLIITLLAVLIFEAILIYILVRFYYTNIESELNASANTIVHNYEVYFNGDDLDRDAKLLMESVSSNTVAQIQIIDREKVVLVDSINPVSVGESLDYPDINGALKGKKTTWRGRNPQTNESILSVSSPIKKNEEVIGVVRVITALTDVNKILFNHVLTLIVLGTFIVILIFVAGVFLSNTIIKPVKEITCAAEAMARGRFDVRVNKRYDDEVGKLADTLNYMAEAVSKHEKMKNDFIASISHEIRTPLTSIIGWVIAINSGNVENSEEIREGLGIVERESERLAAMVEELLDFSKFDAGSINLKIDLVDLKELISHITKQMEPRAKREGIFIVMRTDEDLPFIDADENRLKQVLINIIDNSFKFTQKGGYINIIAKQLKDKVLICVEDNGCGIPEDDISKVTQRFFKGNSNAAGSGLGLAICDEIIKLHNGEMNIESVVEKGTAVNIILPVRA
ncbi:MAG TPA: HAMP domain-containing sensor histidine kinase [Acetivibrio sp.]|nr:HAMP domain-containing sensor histidine kinase [Acetivibrio sp.]